ncbi:MAG TPA: ABC transporter permease [Vicinamibacteria bacterium]|nr:ABC transporter permease [Vicinamibacteria bacterium]
MGAKSELRRTLRSLLQTPRATIVATLTLALGIGASTAIFSVVHAVLLRPLPYPDADRIVQVWQVNDRSPKNSLSLPNFEDLRDRNRSLEAFAIYGTSSVSVSGGSEPVRLQSSAVSRQFFDVLGVEPSLGRRFVEDEMREGAPPAVIVSYGYWQRYLGGNPDLSSSTLRLPHPWRSGDSNDLHPVVGVMGRGFQFPPGTDVWIAQERNPTSTSRTAHNWYAVARLRPDVSLEQARSDLGTIARELRRTYGEETWMVDASVVPLLEEMVGEVRVALLVLTGAVAFLLLVASVNVVNLLLVRAQSRRREIAVSAALGANRWQLTRPFVLESLSLALIGGALGIVLAISGVAALLGFEPGKLPRAGEIGVSIPMLAFALGLTLGTALLLGIAASLRATRADVQRSLHETQRSQAGGAGRGGSSRLLVASQVAMTLTLLVGAGLLGRSLFRLLEVDPGFRAQGKLVMSLFAPYASDAAESRRLAATQEELLARIAAIPGVVRAGSVDRLPMATGYRNGLFLELRFPDEVTSYEDFGRLMDAEERTGFAEYRAASPGFFETMGIPLVGGRLFETTDTMDGRHVAVISQTLAETKWPGEDPMGKLIQFGNMDGHLEALHVVGIVSDVLHGGLDSEPKATIYTNAWQRPTGNFSVVMEVSSDVANIVPAAQRVVSELLPDVPPSFRTMDAVLTDSVAERRFNLLLLAVFGITALGLAVMGVYGVVSYVVSQRTSEIGIRVALGADPGMVTRLVIGEGLRPIAFGIALGLVVAFGLSRFLASLLFEISATDPLTFAALPVVLGIVALAACYAPARAAARLAPMLTLRSE